MSDRRRAALLTAGYYGVVFGALGAHLPYWPVWLDAWGLSEAEIGRYLGLAIIARIAGATLLPALADRWAIRRHMLTVTALIAAAVLLAHLWIDGRGALLAATLIAALTMAPAVPLGDALGLRATERHGIAYAPVRAVGSVTFLVMNVAIGAALGTLGPDVVLWAIVVGFLGVAMLGAVHPGGGAAAGGGDRPAAGEVWQLVRTPAFLACAAAMAAGQASHSVYYVYSVLDWRAQGLSPGIIGWLWAAGVLAETVLMFGPGRHLVASLGPARSLSLAAGAGLLRWATMALGPAEALLWPAQVLHALTFGLAHLGAMAFLAAAVPPRLAGSAQGIAAGAFGGMTTALAAIGAAAIVGTHGTQSAYWLSAGLSGASLVAALLLGRIWSGGGSAGRTAVSADAR